MEERARANGFVVWVTGPNDVMVARVAHAIATALGRRRLDVEVLDGGTPGFNLVTGPGSDHATAFAAARLAQHDVAVVVAVPSPARALRDACRAAAARMIEVYVPGGARAGYEAPERPEVQVDFPETELDGAVARTLRTLEVLGHLRTRDDSAYTEEEEREVIRRLKSFGYL